MIAAVCHEKSEAGHPRIVLVAPTVNALLRAPTGTVTTRMAHEVHRGRCLQFPLVSGQRVTAMSVERLVAPTVRFEFGLSRRSSAPLPNDRPREVPPSQNALSLRTPKSARFALLPRLLEVGSSARGG